MRLALLHSRVRVEERLLFDAFSARGVEPELVDVRKETFDLAGPDRWRGIDLAIDRSMSLSASLTATRVLEAFGVRCVNRPGAIERCADKLRTSLELVRAGVPTPRVAVAASPEAALQAVESVGYPAVLKPTVGSWGRLLARVNDRDAAEAIIEHRATLGSFHHHVFYAQEYIEKPGRDLRVFVVGGEAIAGITRTSEHWVTNTARSATAAGLDITPEIERISVEAAAVTGADIAAVDLLECPSRGLLVNEINHSMEFRNSIDTTGVDIPGRVADHTLHIARAITGAGRAEAAV